MEHDNLQIEIDGAEIDTLYADLVSLQVELDDDLAGMFRLTLGLMAKPDGSWPYLDDDRFALWKKVVVTAGVEDDAQQLISGYVTHIRPAFGLNPEDCFLEIWGMDASVLMDREDKLKDWPNMKDSDIASQILSTYGLTPQVTDTEVIHDEQVSTVIQRETDIQFLRRLALRNGYECYVDGDTGYFQPRQVSATPQPVLSVQFGAESNVNSFSLEVDAMTPTNVSMFQVDRINKEVLDATADSSQDQALGANTPDSYLGTGMQPALVYVGQTVTTGKPEMTALCQGLYERGEWFVTGEGEVAANQYGSVLKPRGTVTIKGIGETYSGVYYVSHVTHSFTADGYTQYFRVKRNALMPTGAEVFSAASGGLLGGLL
jgi:phage protein D